MTPLVGYRVRTPAGIPANVGGLAYDYLVGAGGVYIAAKNAVLDATIRVAAGDIRGLTEVHPGFDLKPGRIPEVIWWAIHDICTAVFGIEQWPHAGIEQWPQGGDNLHHTVTCERRRKGGIAWADRAGVWSGCSLLRRVVMAGVWLGRGRSGPEGTRSSRPGYRPVR